MSMTSNPPRIVLLGLGPIGLGVAEGILDKPDALVLSGAVDIDPELVGRDVGELCGSGMQTGIKVSGSLEHVLRTASPNVVIHCAGSHLDSIVAQIRECVKYGANVVSSSEELFFPWDRHPEIAAEVDTLAATHGVTVLGTGVNPGFSMDTLALVASGAMLHVSELQIERQVDAGRRRLPLQKKVGAGLTVDDFDALKSQGKLGHVGLVESLRFVADGLGWKLDRTTENLDPVVAEKSVPSGFGEISPGLVTGIHHTAQGFVDDRPVISLDLKMYVGAGEEFDAVKAVGDPPIDLIVRGGIFGDTATVAALINAVPLVVDAPPGLKTTKDVPIPRAFGTTP